MYKALVLAVVCIVAHTEASLGGCPSHKSVNDLDLGKYTGTWYVYGFYGSSMIKEKTKCQRYNLENVAMNTISMEITSVIVDSGVMTSWVANSVYTEDSFNVTHPLPDGSSEKLKYQVIATDYDKFAIIWTCSQSSFIWIPTHEEFSAILVRERLVNGTLPEDLSKSITNVLTENKWKLSGYTVVDQSRCDNFNMCSF